MSFPCPLEAAVLALDNERLSQLLKDGLRPWGDAYSPGPVHLALQHPQWLAALSASEAPVLASLDTLLSVAPEGTQERANAIQARLLSIHLEHVHLFIYTQMLHAFRDRQSPLAPSTLESLHERFKQASLFQDVLKESKAWQSVRVWLNHHSEEGHDFAEQMQRAQDLAQLEADRYVKSYDFSVFDPPPVRQKLTSLYSLH